MNNFRAAIVSVSVSVTATLDAGASVSVSMDRLLDALAIVESKNNTNAVGTHGERGAWQMRPVAWREVVAWRRLVSGREHYDADFVFAAHYEVARGFARDYLTMLTHRIQHGTGHWPSLRQLLAAWNWGPTALASVHYNAAKSPASTKEHFARVVRVLNGGAR